jgi:hypothetical protein
MTTPPPPKGFIYAGEGPLAHPSETKTHDILWLSVLGEWTGGHAGWKGRACGPWAVREGSPIAIANGLSPDPALAAFNALAEQINAKLDALNARLDRMEARAAAMESATDPTMRELPWNPEWPEPPPLPEGKTRWVYRGENWDGVTWARDRHVRYYADGWTLTISFSGYFPHIEAV